MGPLIGYIREFQISTSDSNVQVGSGITAPSGQRLRFSGQISTEVNAYTYSWRSAYLGCIELRNAEIWNCGVGSEV